MQVETPGSNGENLASRAARTPHYTIGHRASFATTAKENPSSHRIALASRHHGG
jgi:hypothetical protein